MRKRYLLIFAAVLFGMLAVPSQAYAGYSTTHTYTVGANNSIIRTQAAYLPDRTVTDLELTGPEDIFAGPDGMLYIADTGHIRVLVYDPAKHEIVREITSDAFKAPRGLYVSQSGELYVADSQAHAVFRFNAAGEMIQTYERPTEASYGDTAYNPYRLAVDRAGSLYIVSEGVYNGIIQLSGSGEFLGYFAVNKTTLSLMQQIQQMFFTKEQKANLQAVVPLTFSNVYADPNGVIYSTTMGRYTGGLVERVKKHNTAGQNMLGLTLSSAELTGITTDAQGIIYACDKRGGIIIYTPDGEYIFDFGAFGDDMDIAGLYTELIAITVASDGTIWTIDNKKAYLQSYTPTDFALKTYGAIELFNDGQYTNSRIQWAEVLRLNQMSVLAHNGIGKAYLYEQDYSNALSHFQISGNRDSYSDAFWEIRNDLLQSSLPSILILLIVLMVANFALKFIDRKNVVKTTISNVLSKPLKVSYIADMTLCKKVAFNPMDVYYDMKRGKFGGLPAAVTMYVLLFLSFMLFMLGKAFIVQANIETIDTRALVIGFFAITILFIICNFLVTSISDGEGDLILIFKTFAYASGPIIIALLLYSFMTYTVTMNEMFVLNFMLSAGAAWSALLLLLGLQEIHGYSFGTNIKSLIITAFFILIVAVVLLILMLLWDQIIQFFQAVGKELIASVFNLE